jgi:putative ABC transport system permease protein
MPSRVRRFFRVDRGAVDVPGAISDELQFHFQSSIEELVAQGWSEEDARREAHRRFGDLEQTRLNLEDIDLGRVTQERRAQWWSGLLQDARYAWRGLRHSPGFTIGVMLTLALGIGANAMMFNIVDPMLFRAPAGLANPGRTNRVYVRSLYLNQPYYRGSFSWKNYEDFARDTRAFSRVVAFWSTKMAIGNADAVQEQVAGVSAAFWQQFPVQPALGRFFTSEEDQLPSGEPVVVLSWPYWKSHFGGRRDVLGDHVKIGSMDYTVIGVAPRELLGFDRRRPMGYLPITSIAANVLPARTAERRFSASYNMSWLHLAMERRPGVSREAAEADLQNAVVRSYTRRHELDPSASTVEDLQPVAVLAPVQEEAGPNRSAESRVGTWLAGVALLVLLIACANVGNLLLARALRRRREIALRLALGVTRARLLAQLLTESLLLAILGGALALGVAAVGGGLLRRTLLPGAEAVATAVDSRSLVFAGVTVLVVAVLCGIAPALQVLRSDLAASLKGGGREGSYQRSRLRTGLLVLQGALSVVLLVGAGLFVASLRAVRAAPLGYDTDQVMFVETNQRGEQLSEDEAYQLQERLLARVEQLPGVVAASRAATVPFYMDWGEDLFVPGIDSVSKLGDFSLQTVTGDYFATMGTRILDGRGITEADRAGSARVIVVSQAMAKLLWPGQRALGKCVKVGADSMPCQYVVGVAEDIKHSSLRDDPGLMYYVPLAQIPEGITGILVRTAAPAATTAESIRRQLQAEMPGNSYLTATPLADLVAPEMRSWQLGATLFTVFGGLALLVASVGLYSVLAYTVAQRRQEMGVRVALGATTRRVVRMVVSDAVRLTVIAVGLGLGASLVAARWVAPLLFDTSPRDPVILGGVGATLLLVSVAASLAPAWRAARTDPVAALRSD